MDEAMLKTSDDILDQTDEGEGTTEEGGEETAGDDEEEGEAM